MHSIYDEIGNSIFPERFTSEIIEDIKNTQGSYLFSCQYLNNPVDDQNAKFKKSQIKYYEDKDLEGKQLATYYTIDRAYSLAKTADYTAHLIGSVDLDNNLYVRLALRTREHEGLMIDRIFDNKNYFKVITTGIEQHAYTDTIKPTLDSEMRKRNNFFGIQELKGKTSKIARIEALVPRFEAGSIYIKKDMTDLEDELLRFPMNSHDDLIDALAYQLDLIKVPEGSQFIPEFDLMGVNAKGGGYYV